MWSKVERFTEWCRLRYASGTVETKVIHLKAFHRWLMETDQDYWQVDQGQVERFLLSQQCCRERKKDMLYTLRQFYTFVGLPNPAENIHMTVDHSRKLPKLPARKSIVRIIEGLALADDELATRNRLLVEFAYGSGLRRNELVLLNVEDVDFAGRCVHVTGKGDRQRIVPLTTKSVNLLRGYLLERRHRRISGPLFQNYWYGSRMRPRSISKIFKTNTGHNTHSFRHACATHMLANGCNLRNIQELLGHTKLSTTQVYTHVDSTRLTAVLQATHPRAKSVN